MPGHCVGRSAHPSMGVFVSLHPGNHKPQAPSLCCLPPASLLPCALQAELAHLVGQGAGRVVPLRF